MSVPVCPKCNEAELEYLGDNCTGEIEDWHCPNCETGYEVDVVIHRHFETMREVIYLIKKSP